MEEILHTTTSKSLQVCLVKTGTTTPMISSLELRPLGNNSYITESGSLNLFVRMYINKTDGFVRYPDDVYDRRWHDFFLPSWTQISTNLEVSNDNDYNAPKKALATAATPSNVSAPLTISWTSDKPGDQYYLYSHFAEIQDLQTNDTREFDLSWNGAVTVEAFTPRKLVIDTFLNKFPETCKGKCIYQLIKTSRSTLPPLLNALEIYKVIQFPQSETNENDVVAIKSIEAVYGLSRIKWQGDPCVPPLYAWDGLNCSITDISKPPRITSLNLSSSGLTGSIAAAIQNLTQLQKLDLSNNKLTGVVPEFLAQMKSLLIINLSGNDLNGTLPQALQRKGLELLVQGNPRLCLSGSCTEKSKKKFPLVIVASVASVAIIVIVLVLIFVLRKKKLPSVEALQPQLSTATSNDTYANSSKPSIETKKRRFTYSEVMKMTNNFQRVVGEGGFGVVCHGTVNGSEQVAVKLLSQSSTQGYKEFKAEVELLLRVHHKNLVSLVGYCNEGDHMALIYEFMPNGDLRQHLTGKRSGSFINWGNRLRISLEAALGLEYLHSGCTPPIVHRDIKTTNILLDEQYKAKLADFGLSKSLPWKYGPWAMVVISPSLVLSNFTVEDMLATQRLTTYPNDAYDRLWSPYLRPEWTQISTTSDVVNSNGYDPPKAALKTAAIPTDASEPLTINWTNSNHPDDQYYVYAHFAEIQELQSNETREFNMVWNGEVYDENYILLKFRIRTIFDKLPSKACDGGKCSFQLIRTDESTLPPLINAWEVFTVIHFPQSDTHENDVVAITSIKDAYELNRINWQGDPCVPHNLMWDGLNCSNTDISTPPRITSLNLSSSGLTGTIAPAIQNLSQLEKLDLSNNNLTGELPEFLGNIKSLLFINLSGNNFNGSIPQALRKKGLELHVQGNPMLGDPRSPTKKNLVPILASVASVAIVIAVLVISLLLRNKKSTTGEGVQNNQASSA